MVYDTRTLTVLTAEAFLLGGAVNETLSKPRTGDLLSSLAETKKKDISVTTSVQLKEAEMRFSHQLTAHEGRTTHAPDVTSYSSSTVYCLSV